MRIFAPRKKLIAARIKLYSRSEIFHFSLNVSREPLNLSQSDPSSEAAMSSCWERRVVEYSSVCGRKYFSISRELASHLCASSRAPFRSLGNLWNRLSTDLCGLKCLQTGPGSRPLWMACSDEPGISVDYYHWELPRTGFHTANINSFRGLRKTSLSSEYVS